MEELKNFLNEIKEIIDKKVLYGTNIRENFYYVGQMNLLSEILDEIREIENNERLDS